MNAVSTLDDRTAAAIRDAIRAASAGRLRDAFEIGERALADGGDPAALNAMIGSLRCQAGEHEAGIRHLRVAHAGRPDDPVITANLATALAQQGDNAGALEVLSEEIAETDPTMRLKRIRAYLAQQALDFDVSIAAYEAIVAAAPADWESWNNLGNTLRLSGDLAGSVTALQHAAELNPVSAPTRLNYATALAAAGQIGEAEKQLRRVVNDFPKDSMALRELHALMKEIGREEAALEAIEEAVRRVPADIELLLALASHRLSMLRNDAAEDAYRQVLKLQPDHDLANLGLAVVFELSNRAGDLASLVEDVQERGVGEDALNFIRAMDHRRAKRFTKGLAALERVPEDLESTRRYHLLGQLQEGAANYDEAFDAFSRMNALQGEDPTRPAERASAYRDGLRLQIDAVKPEWAKRWRNETRKDARASPAFLVGFPRSGTTLLDTMLMGHPDIEVLEEEPTLLEAAKRLQPFEELPSASDSLIREARDDYFRIAAKRTRLAPGKLLVDKNPLSMNGLPIIARLFPDARIILALRHPCDVVLSCYVTNFKLNDGMSSFLRLETAAELYDLSFRYFDRVQELLQLPVHRVIYENVVADREGELRPLFEFLGLDWSDDVLDHEAIARTRGRIKTASYAQVAEPIYSRSAGRWKNYEKHLEPVLPILEPWVRKFGYSL